MKRTHPPANTPLGRTSHGTSKALTTTILYTISLMPLRRVSLLSHRGPDPRSNERKTAPPFNSSLPPLGYRAGLSRHCNRDARRPPLGTLFPFFLLLSPMIESNAMHLSRKSYRLLQDHSLPKESCPVEIFVPSSVLKGRHCFFPVPGFDSRPRRWSLPGTRYAPAVLPDRRNEKGNKLK